MARFVMASRRAGKFQESGKRLARAAMAEALAGPLMAGATVLADDAPVDETLGRITVLEADPAEIAALRGELSSDVILEPEILHYPIGFVPADVARDADIGLVGDTTAAGAQETVVEVLGENGPLEGAVVTLFLRFGTSNRKMERVTQADGRVVFKRPPLYAATTLVVVPAGGHWAMAIRGPGSSVTVTCPALPAAERRLGWWHTDGGIDEYVANRGSGIRVGVIDSGVGPHPYLSHVNDLGSVLSGVADAAGGQDSGSHGSHVIGTIGARTSRLRDFSGISPGVDLMSIRVFEAGKGADQADVARAVEILSMDHRADLINMSMAAKSRSEILADRITDAFERGTLCVCAAGNSSGVVTYPAALESTVAVSALGQLGWGPPGSLAAGREPNSIDRYGTHGLYLANFSCFGPEITSASPGVGVISTVPARPELGLDRPYASMDGTSMASPLACAILSNVLASSSAYLSAPRDDSRAECALQLLRESCTSIAIDRKYEGQGRPQVNSVGAGPSSAVS